MDENKIEMTEDIEYWLFKAKAAIDQAVLDRDPLLCLSQIRQAEIAIRSHINYLQVKPEAISA